MGRSVVLDLLRGLHRDRGVGRKVAGTFRELWNLHLVRGRPVGGRHLRRIDADEQTKSVSFRARTNRRFKRGCHALTLGQNLS